MILFQVISHRTSTFIFTFQGYSLLGQEMIHVGIAAHVATVQTVNVSATDLTAIRAVDAVRHVSNQASDLFSLFSDHMSFQGSRRWKGCACARSAKLCGTKKCPCFRAHIECDPEVCMSCESR